MKWNRRDFLQAAGNILLLSGVARLPVFAQPLGEYPFTLGVASGDPWPDGFVIWTRLAPRPLEEHGGMPAARVPMRWEVAEDEQFKRVVRQGETLAIPELAHSVHVEVEGLQPHRHYWYRFSTAGSDVSPEGLARTAPARDAVVERLRIGVAGCQHYEMGYYEAWKHLAAEPDLDLVFHYGDYIYEGGATALGPRQNATWQAVRQHVGNEIYSIDDYRRRYALYKSDADLQAAHAACAFAVSFDDHEVDNNFAGDFDQDGTAPEIFVLRKLGALQAWYEHMPVRRAQFPQLSGLTAYRRLDFGQLLRMHVLDTRSYRSDQPCNDDRVNNPCDWDMHNSPDVLGRAQERWLDEGLSKASSWNLLAQQIIVMPVDFREKDATEGDFATDLWDGYRPARRRLIESIKKHDLKNVIVATGDHHRHLVGEVPENDDDLDGAKVAVEFQAASITSNGDSRGEAPVSHMLSNNPHFAYYADSRGYQLFDISPKQWLTEVKVLDKVSERGGAIRTERRFAVEPGRPKLEEV
jgi:Phosphodiesterase/alkaline phosphatase D